MSKKRREFIGVILAHIVGTLIVLPFALWYSSWTTSVAQENNPKKLTIVCTTGMIADAVSFICQDHAVVHALMGAGVDPHLYVARSGDIQKLSDADIIFYNGLHLEGKMNTIFQSLQSQKTVIAVSEGVPVELLRRCEYQGMFDPHIWHDVLLWKYAVEYAASVIVARDPENGVHYMRRATEYQQKLSELHEWVQKSIMHIDPEKRMLLTAHDAFWYFGKQYGLQVVGLQGLSTDSGIGAKDIINFVNFVVEHQVQALFIESSISERGIVAVTQAAAARGHTIVIGKELFSDALGDEYTGTHTYFGMIKHNVAAIVHALSGKDVTA